jgi:hypothetical protein
LRRNFSSIGVIKEVTTQRGQRPVLLPNLNESAFDHSNFQPQKIGESHARHCRHAVE